jgi:hypothetical protein
MCSSNGAAAGGCAVSSDRQAAKKKEDEIFRAWHAALALFLYMSTNCWLHYMHDCNSMFTYTGDTIGTASVHRGHEHVLSGPWELGLLSEANYLGLHYA